MIEFTHQIPTKIILGPDKLGQLGTELAAFGKKVLVVMIPVIIMDLRRLL